MRVPFILQGSCWSVMAGGDSFPTACEEAAVSDSWAAQWPGGFLPSTGPALVSTADWCPPKLSVIWQSETNWPIPGPWLKLGCDHKKKALERPMHFIPIEWPSYELETGQKLVHMIASYEHPRMSPKRGMAFLTHDTFQTCSAAFLNPGFFPSRNPVRIQKQPRQTWSDPPWLWCKLRAAGMTWRVRWQMRFFMRYTEEHKTWLGGNKALGVGVKMG